MDRGYNDYDLFDQLTRGGVFFVARIKKNASYVEISQNKLPITKRHILDDQHITLSNGSKYRKVAIFNEVNEQYLEFITNNFDLAADTIAQIYKSRWNIETFFKSVKQNFKIKTFVGTSKNAVLIQLWIALTAILILTYLKYK